VERNLDLQDDCLRGSSGAKFGRTGTVAKIDLWN